jgi:hypothetical protein
VLAEYADGSHGGDSSQSYTQMSQEYAEANAHDQEEEEPLSKNDAWHVITSYFDEKGLVRQQLDRYARPATMWRPRPHAGGTARHALVPSESAAPYSCMLPHISCVADRVVACVIGVPRASRVRASSAVGLLVVRQLR